jgi:hypothetical protein
MKDSKDIKYVTPQELRLLKIAHRPEVLRRCERDCTVLINEENQEVVRCSSQEPKTVNRVFLGWWSPVPRFQ